MANAGKNAIIIGGTHGMGLAAAQLLLNSGAKLSDKAHVVKCDITSLPNIDHLVEETKSVFGADKVDFLFVNAGYAHLEPFAAATEKSFCRTIDTNLFGGFFVALIFAQKFAPLARDCGAIVFTSSVSARFGFPGMAVYSASKAAVSSLVQTLAAELASRKVKVNAVSPGFVKTPEELVAFEEEGSKLTPLGRIGSAEVAKAAVFLAFEATFTTGTEVFVDGGLGRMHS